MWGILACWHRWRSAQFRRMARRALNLSDRLALAAHAAFVEALDADDKAKGGGDGARR